MKYVVSAVATISLHTIVEADSCEEAIDEARQRSMIGLCHQCSRGDSDSEWVTSGELDGEAENLCAEEA